MNDNVNITAVFVSGNAPPVADDQDVTTAENTPVDITLTGTDPDGDGLTYRITVLPDSGQLDTSQLPLVRYTPNPGFTGTDTFRFRVNDGVADSNEALVTITVGPASQFTFYGVFDRLTDTDSLGMHPAGRLVMSRDGSTLAFTGSGCVFIGGTGGSNLTRYDLPMLSGASGLAIDGDGSRVFLCGNAAQSGAPNLVVKIEGGALSELPIGDLGIRDVQTTADGEYAYFSGCDGSFDIWRIRHNGTGQQKVVEDTAVPRDSGQSCWVGDFAVSADAGTIAFEIQRYKVPGSGAATKEELFVLEGGSGGTFRQLTNDNPKKGKDKLAISPDGSTIVFYTWSPTEWYTIAPDGSALTLLDGIPGGGTVVSNNDGSMLRHANGLSIDMQGSVFDSFPYGVNANGDTLAMNGEGGRVAFVRRTQSLPTNKYAVVVGHFNDAEAVADAPRIESIAFNPPVMPTGDPEARVILTARVSDPQGLSDIAAADIEPYIDGLNVRGSAPVSFVSPRDDGEYPDALAGDGLFTSEGRPGGSIENHDQMTVRVEIRDASHTRVIADAVLLIGE
jgi:hypothetical protein